ncbi:MAG: hypothetical protein WBV94_10515 [Blastocatellia bacterium]
MKCPSFERLIDYLDGRLTGDADEPIRTHVAAGCYQCDRSRAFYESVRATAASDDTIEPPLWVFKRALRIFDRSQDHRAIGYRVGRLIASLVFDSLRAAAFAGARSTAAENHQLLYRAEDYSIDLQITPGSQNRADVTGQLLREGDLTFESVAGLALALTGDGRRAHSTATNERGEFTINAVDCGYYDLQIANITIVGLPVT